MFMVIEWRVFNLIRNLGVFCRVFCFWERHFSTYTLYNKSFTRFQCDIRRIDSVVLQELFVDVVDGFIRDFADFVCARLRS